MDNLVARSVLTAVLTCAWFAPQVRFIRPRVPATVDGGIVGAMLVVTVHLSSALAARLGLGSGEPNDVLGFSVQAAVVVLVQVVIAAAAPYLGWGVRQVAGG